MARRNGRSRGESKQTRSTDSITDVGKVQTLADIRETTRTCCRVTMNTCGRRGMSVQPQEVSQETATNDTTGGRDITSKPVYTPTRRSITAETHRERVNTYGKKRHERTITVLHSGVTMI